MTLKKGFTIAAIGIVAVVVLDKIIEQRDSKKLDELRDIMAGAIEGLGHPEAHLASLREALSGIHEAPMMFSGPLDYVRDHTIH